MSSNAIGGEPGAEDYTRGMLQFLGHASLQLTGHYSGSQHVGPLRGFSRMSCIGGLGPRSALEKVTG